MEVKVASHVIIPSDPLSKFLLPISETLGSAGLEVLVPKKWMLLPEDSHDTIEVEVGTASLWPLCKSTDREEELLLDWAY